MSAVAAAAARYAANGLAVFPLRAGSKLPATEHGCLDASTDPDMVSAMFAAVGERANVGVATAGLAVVDLDGERGLQGWQRLCAEHGRIETRVSRTPRGWHVWLKAPANVEIRNSAGRIAAGIDVRGVGGYVVAPPSRVDPSDDKPGGVYRWARSTTAEMATVPGWLLPMMLPPAPPARTEGHLANYDVGDRYVQAAVSGEVARVTSAVPGTRNVSLRAAAFALGRFVGAGVLAHGIAEQQLRQAGEAVGLGVVEVGRTVARGLRDGALEPRQIQRRTVAA